MTPANRSPPNVPCPPVLGSPRNLYESPGIPREIQKRPGAGEDPGTRLASIESLWEFPGIRRDSFFFLLCDPTPPTTFRAHRQPDGVVTLHPVAAPRLGMVQKGTGVVFVARGVRGEKGGCPFGVSPSPQPTTAAIYKSLEKSI